MDADFLSGVVEGFYGQPWSQSQRMVLLPQLAEWGLNTYFYAPKDDLKHRAIWRERYDEHELLTLDQLVKTCDQHGINFIYGLSPGLDIRFSDDGELSCIQQRFDQLMQLGVRHFALLFDDLPGQMTAADLEIFASVAAAQCAVTNSIFGWLESQLDDTRLLFCPTPYCDRMVRWGLGGRDYLDIVGTELAPKVEFLWTGPEIISQEITTSSIQRLGERIKRAPVIWDNLQANDYDLRRLYCGPYSGRSADLLSSVRGILLNPNNEFWINYVPLRTMAQYLAEPSMYEPRDAYVRAVDEWVGYFETVQGQLAVADLQLLADCYYLPHEEGEAAVALLRLVTELIRQPVATWGDKYDEFLEYHRRIVNILEALTQLKNRELFYAWSRRIWELKEEMDLLHDYLENKRSEGNATLGEANFHSETHLEKTYRGGMVAALQRQTAMDAQGRFRSVSDQTVTR